MLEKTTQVLTALHKDKQAYIKILKKDYSDIEKQPYSVTLQQLSDEIEILQNTLTRTEKTEELHTEYVQLQEALKSQEEKLNAIKEAEAALKKEIDESAQQLHAAKEQLDFKENIYQQQQVIANYEKDRTELQPGEPCPLCLSTSHPFHTHPIKPYVSEAKQEYIEAKKTWQKTDKKHQKRIQDQQKIAVQIAQYTEEENGILPALHRKTHDITDRIAELVPGFPNTEIPKNDITAMRKNIKSKKQIRQKIVETVSALEEIEKTIHTTKATLHTSEKTIHTHQQQLANLSEQYEKNSNETALVSTRIQELCTPYTIRFSHDKATEVLADLQRRNIDYQEKSIKPWKM